jgi:hypothetical protein
MEGIAMDVQIKLSEGALIFAEIQEFGSFAVEAQHFIGRALDVAFAPEFEMRRWARSEEEANDIGIQQSMYRALPAIRRSIPRDSESAAADSFLSALIAVSIFDLSGGALETFSHYRFLYERLLGAGARPWLEWAFAAAAALPHHAPQKSDALLASLGDDPTKRWSSREPAFYPVWLGS